MDNRRKAERIQKTIKCEVHAEEMTFSSTIDISSGGFFISTPEPPEIGTALELVFDIPGHGETAVAGQVKWIRDEQADVRAGMGVEFVDAESDMLEKLQSYLQS